MKAELINVQTVCTHFSSHLLFFGDRSIPSHFLTAESRKTSEIDRISLLFPSFAANACNEEIRIYECSIKTRNSIFKAWCGV